MRADRADWYYQDIPVAGPAKKSCIYFLNHREADWPGWQPSEILYIGQTMDLRQRLDGHKSSRFWWGLVNEISAVRIARKHLDSWERDFIGYYRPRYNWTHNPEGWYRNLWGGVNRVLREEKEAELGQWAKEQKQWIGLEAELALLETAHSHWSDEVRIWIRSDAD